MNKTIATFLLAFLLVACGQHNHGHVVHGAESHDVDPAIYASAVANPARSDADRARDAGRKPAEVLKFFGITPGMKVFDMFSGGGYYAEILTHVVGDTGLVVAHTNETSLGYVSDEFNARYGDDRLPIVEILMAENNELELEAVGFALDAKSDLLRNMEDDHSKGVFDPTIRGRTDRFMLRFRKRD